MEIPCINKVIVSYRIVRSGNRSKQQRQSEKEKKIDLTCVQIFQDAARCAL